MLFRPSVRPSVTAYLENHIFAQSYIIMRLKMFKVDFWKKFLLSAIFLNDTSEFAITWSENWGIVLEPFLAMVCVENFFFGCFGQFMVKNALLVVTKYCFWPFFALFRLCQYFDVPWPCFVFWTIIMVSSWKKKIKKIVEKFCPFLSHFWSNNWPFLDKNQVFGHFFSK